MRDACSKDILFYLNGFAWTLDPRLPAEGKPPEVPFIAYPFQEEVLLTLAEKIGKDDLLIEKSRDQGASWMCLYAMDWMWRFRRNLKFFLMSRADELVDATSDMNALFPKLDFLEEHLPFWLRAKLVRNNKLRHNCETNSTFTGAATTGRSGAGGRMTAALVDEFALFEPNLSFQSLASLQHATRSRIFNSTPRGQFGAYYEVRKKMGQVKPQNVLTLHWSKHPVQAKGLYRPRDGGQFDVLDKDGLPAEYKMRFEVPKGPWKVRSPWYDNECDRTPIPALIAQELDIDYVGSGAAVFDPEVIDRLISDPKLATVRSPVQTGDLDYDDTTNRAKTFISLATGRLKLWLNLLPGNIPPPDRQYIVSADIALGTGASSSALAVVDRATGEKVAGYSNPNIGPEAFADLAMAVAWWFNEAEMIWEMNGPGLVFGKRVVARGYRKFYLKRDESGDLARKQTSTPGFHTNDKTKFALFRRYMHMLARGTYVNREIEALRQCLEYIYDGDKIEHQSVRDNKADGEGRENHGDSVIADALGAWLLEDKPLKKDEPREYVPKRGTLAWLENEAVKRETEMAAAAEEW